MVPYITQRKFILTDFQVKIGSAEFKNPVFVASGTFGYGVEIVDLVDISKIGAIVTKSISLMPREGNPPPRIVETSSGMINSIGLANIGVEKYIEEMLPQYAQISTPIITNIVGWTFDDYIEVLRKLETVSSNIIGYEINISCPNVKKGGMEFGTDPETVERLTSTLRKTTDRLLIMKLSPNVTDIASIALSAERGGADAVSAINTVVGMSIDPYSHQSNIFTTFGGLSGPAIKPIGLAAVQKVYRKVTIPIIGIGGISSGNDVVEYMLAGASAVQVGTATFRHPDAANQIFDQLKTYCQTQNIQQISNLTGKVKLHS